jgi:hypothetical protein
MGVFDREGNVLMLDVQRLSVNWNNILPLPSPGGLPGAKGRPAA